MIYTFIHFEEIPSEKIFAKFKEFYFDKTQPVLVRKRTDDDTYHQINLKLIETIIIYDDNFVCVFGMVGKFFI